MHKTPNKGSRAVNKSRCSHFVTCVICQKATSHFQPRLQKNSLSDFTCNTPDLFLKARKSFARNELMLSFKNNGLFPFNFPFYRAFGVDTSSADPLYKQSYKKYEGISPSCQPVSHNDVLFEYGDSNFRFNFHHFFMWVMDYLVE